MQELIAITQNALQSQSWKMKAQGAAAMASIAKQQTGSLVPPHLGMILNALLQGIAGRTWAGKEELLKAVASVVTACSAELRKSVPDQPSIDTIIQVMLKECHKENLRYKMVALKCIANILRETKEDFFQDLVDILFPVIKKSTATGSSRKEDNEEEEEEPREKELRMEYLLCAFDTLGKAWPRTPETQTRYQVELCHLMCERLKLSTWKVQLGVLQAMNTYFQGLLLLSQGNKDTSALSEILKDTFSALTFPLENKSYSSVRAEALSILELLFKKLEETNQWATLTSEKRDVILKALTSMESDNRPELKDRASVLKKCLASVP